LEERVQQLKAENSWLTKSGFELLEEAARWRTHAANREADIKRLEAEVERLRQIATIDR
jgi:hypothetical protein